MVKQNTRFVKWEGERVEQDKPISSKCYVCGDVEDTEDGLIIYCSDFCQVEAGGGYIN